jgi:hypothetical protein
VDWQVLLAFRWLQLVAGTGRSIVALRKMYSLPILELLQDSFDPPLTRERLARLEIELNVKFSQEYEDFLLQFNGGYFHRPVMFYVPNSDRWA